MVSLGIDLGGTKTALGIVNAHGEISKRLSFSSKSPTFEAYYLKLRSNIQKLLDDYPNTQGSVSGLGVGCAGQIHPESGLIHHSPNLGWRNAPLGDKLRSDFSQLKIAIDNDVRAATLGEYLFGLDQRPSIYINIFLGTGIGSGIVIHDQILRGASNCAGEVGLTSICHDGPRSESGNLGVFESYASGTALTHYARELIQTQLREKPKEAQGNRLCDLLDETSISGESIGDLASQGQTEALSLVRKLGYFAGVGLVNLINLLNPEIITFGGGVANLGKPFLEIMLKTIENRAIPCALDAVKILPVKLGSEAGIIGATCLFRVDSQGKIGELHV